MKKLLIDAIIELTLRTAYSFDSRFSLYAIASSFVITCVPAYCQNALISRIYFSMVFSLFSSSLRWFLNGISGLSTSRRDGFNHMIEDCLAGRIEIFLRTLIQCPAHGSVENGLKQRLSADLSVLPKAFFMCVGHDTNLTGESPVTGSYRQV